MKHASEYARKVRRLYGHLKRRYGTPRLQGPVNLIDQLLLGVLYQGTTMARARKVLEKLRSSMVDLNELRVSHPPDLVEVMGPGFPHALRKAKQIIHLLNQVYQKQHTLCLDHLENKSKREIRRFIEGLRGVSPVVISGAILTCLGGHAVPVDENMWRVLRAENLVDPDCDVAEVQAFLERNISASEAYAFTQLLRRYSEERVGNLGPLPEAEDEAAAVSAAAASMRAPGKPAVRDVEKKKPVPVPPSRAACAARKPTRRVASASRKSLVVGRRSSPLSKKAAPRRATKRR